MNPWFRHYVGLTSDPKFGRVMRNAFASRERVVFVWCYLLENACERNQDGTFEVDPEDIADLLDCDTSDIKHIIEAFKAGGFLADGRIAKWSKRQYKSDQDKTSAERQRRLREKRAAAGHEDVTRDMPVTERDTTVTRRDASSLSRTDTDADTDTDSERRTSQGEAQPLQVGAVREALGAGVWSMPSPFAEEAA